MDNNNNDQRSSTSGNLSDFRQQSKNPGQSVQDSSRDNDPPRMEADAETNQPNFVPCIDDIKIALKFIDALKTASLDSELEPLEKELLEQICHPPEEILTIDNPDHRLSLDIFLSISNASEESYNSVCTAILCRYPDSKILTK